MQPLTIHTAELQLHPHLRVRGRAHDDMGIRSEFRKLRSPERWSSGSHLDLPCYAVRLWLRDRVHGRNGVDGAHERGPISLGF